MAFISVGNIRLYAIFYSFIVVRRTCTGCNILSLNILITAPIPQPDPLNGRTGKPPPPTLTTNAALCSTGDKSPCCGEISGGELGLVAPEMLIAFV